MTPPLPLVERKQRRARQRIIEAARELFLERGFDGVSVGDIAERAEVGRTTFFRHFGDKQEVVFAQEQELLDTITAAGRAEGTPAARSATGAVEQLRPARPRPLRPGDGRPRGLHPPLPAHRAAPGAARPRRRRRRSKSPTRLSELLIHRGTRTRPPPASPGQIAIACYQTAKRLGNNPLTLVDDTRAAFGRALTLGAGAAEAPAEP